MSTDLLFSLGNLKKASFYVIHFRKSGNGQIRHISQISRLHLESTYPDTQLSCFFYQNITISSDCMDISLWRATIFSHKTLSAAFLTQLTGGGNYCVHIALNEFVCCFLTLIQFYYFHVYQARVSFPKPSEAMTQVLC